MLLPYKKLFLTLEQNRPRIALSSNSGTFRVEKGEVSQDDRTPKAVAHHLSAATTNIQFQLGYRTIKAEKR